MIGAIKDNWNLEDHKEDFNVFLDGNTTQTEEQFLEAIGLQINGVSYRNWATYIDDMKDLSWISESKINIVIENSNQFLISSSITRQDFLDDYINDIFLFWREEAAMPERQCRNIKDISVYLI